MSGRQQRLENSSCDLFWREQSGRHVNRHRGGGETAPSSPSPKPGAAQTSALKRARDGTEHIRKPQQQLAWLKTTARKATTWKSFFAHLKAASVLRAAESSTTLYGSQTSGSRQAQRHRAGACHFFLKRTRRSTSRTPPLPLEPPFLQVKHGQALA